MSFDLHAQVAETFRREHNVDYGYRRLETLGFAAEVFEDESVWRKQVKGAPSWVDCKPSEVQQLGTTDTTAQVHPFLFVNALIDAAKKNTGGKTQICIGTVSGLTVYEDADGTRIKGIIVGRTEHEFDVVIIAAGPWTQYASTWNSLVGGTSGPLSTKTMGLDILKQISGERYHSVTIKAKV